MIVIGNDITISDSLTKRMTVVNQHNEIEVYACFLFKPKLAQGRT